MSDVVAFLTARLDEDEAAALTWRDVAGGGHDRMMREVAAKRAMMAALTRWPFDYRAECDDETRTFMHLLASVYSDHPDYDPAWSMS